MKIDTYSDAGCHSLFFISLFHENLFCSYFWGLIAWYWHGFSIIHRVFFRARCVISYEMHLLIVCLFFQWWMGLGMSHDRKNDKSHLSPCSRWTEKKIDKIKKKTKVFACNCYEGVEWMNPGGGGLTPGNQCSTMWIKPNSKKNTNNNQAAWRRSVGRKRKRLRVTTSPKGGTVERWAYQRKNWWWRDWRLKATTTTTKHMNIEMIWKIKQIHKFAPLIQSIECENTFKLIRFINNNKENYL